MSIVFVMQMQNDIIYRLLEISSSFCSVSSCFLNLKKHKTKNMSCVWIATEDKQVLN